MGNVIIEELEQIVALLLFEPNDVPGELRVHVESLLSSRWMSAHDWMDLYQSYQQLYQHDSSFPHRADWSPSNERAFLLRGCGLLIARMDSLQTEKTLSEGRRQAFKCLHLIGEKSIATGFGDVQGIEEGCAGRLILVCHITVPGY